MSLKPRGGGLQPPSSPSLPTPLLMHGQVQIPSFYLEAVDECNESTDEAAEQHGED